AACGLLAGRFAVEELLFIEGGLAPHASLPPAASGSPEATHGSIHHQWTPNLPPSTTALGALLNHVTAGANAATFQPMNVNFGLFPPLTVQVKKDGRPQAYTSRALADLAGWTSEKIAA
ncbi:MAG: hypothetical protein K2X09_03835, partial [Rickettsiales bacterium]|nr:hypothetical protein [Rickettsiales bacterium]